MVVETLSHSESEVSKRQAYGLTGAVLYNATATAMQIIGSAADSQVILIMYRIVASI